MGVCLCIPPMGYLVMGGSTRGVNTPQWGGGINPCTEWGYYVY